VSAPERASRAELVQRLVVDLGAAFQHRTTYAPDHPQVTGTIARLLAALSEWCARSETPEVSLILLEGHLLVDRESIPDEAPWGRGLLRAFHRYGIQGMTLLAGLEAGELGSFLDACAGGQRPTPSRHILIGQAGALRECEPGGALSRAGGGSERRAPGHRQRGGHADRAAALPGGEARARGRGRITRVRRPRGHPGQRP
jgi:hypothetical protein